MEFLRNLFRTRPQRPVVTRRPAGWAFIDLREAPRPQVRDGSVLGQCAAELDEGPPPVARAFILPSAALAAWSENAVVMLERARALHRVTLRRGANQEPIPDAVVIDGDVDAVGPAAYLLWSLGLEPYPMGTNGELPIVEATTALGSPICGMVGERIGREPPDRMLRRVFLALDDLERQSDAAAAAGDAKANGVAVEKMLEIQTAALDYVSGVLRKA